VIQNLGMDAASNVALAVAQGSLCGPLTASVAYPASMAATSVPAPDVTAAGGFSGYMPLATIPARATVVISLSP
jgi:hypothetical protein